MIYKRCICHSLPVLTVLTASLTIPTSNSCIHNLPCVYYLFLSNVPLYYCNNMIYQHDMCIYNCIRRNVENNVNPGTFLNQTTTPLMMIYNDITYLNDECAIKSSILNVSCNNMIYQHMCSCNCTHSDIENCWVIK